MVYTGRYIRFSPVFIILFLLPVIAVAQTGTKEPYEGFVYFADREKTGLKSVKKRFAADLNPHELGLSIMEILMAGPLTQKLTAVWPKDANVRAFFISDDKKAYVDLDVSRQMLAPMDTRSEMLAVYALVNSLTVNIPKIKKVKILIQGREVQTLAGHVDLEPFYQTNMLIVK